MLYLKIGLGVIIGLLVLVWFLFIGPLCLNANSDILPLLWPACTLFLLIAGGVFAYRWIRAKIIQHGNP